MRRLRFVDNDSESPFQSETTGLLQATASNCSEALRLPVLMLPHSPQQGQASTAHVEDQGKIDLSLPQRRGRHEQGASWCG